MLDHRACAQFHPNLGGRGEQPDEFPEPISQPSQMSVPKYWSTSGVVAGVAGVPGFACFKCP